jgi:hypothetical protein
LEHIVISMMVFHISTSYFNENAFHYFKECLMIELILGQSN